MVYEIWYDGSNTRVERINTYCRLRRLLGGGGI
jgi:hypothetical protein